MEEKRARAVRKEEVDAEKHHETRDGVWYVPSADVFETKDGVTVLLDMPGVATENVHINVQESDLVVSGLIVPESHPNEQPTHTEYGVGHFHRHFSMAADFDVDKIEAKMKDGVLKVTLPKRMARQPRKIEVRMG